MSKIPAEHADVVVASSVASILVDEASQVWSGLALLLDAAFPRVTRLHLFGDDRQLPPSLSPGDKSASTLAATASCRSLFDDARDGGVITHALRVQHRMPLALASFISHWCAPPIPNKDPLVSLVSLVEFCFPPPLQNERVYDNRLISSPSMCPSPDAVLWLCTKSRQGVIPGSSSALNDGESRAIHQLTAHIDGLAAFKHKSCVVITPFTGQRNLVEATCGSSSRNGGRWDVKTVDSFQGRECACMRQLVALLASPVCLILCLFRSIRADVVILSLVRSDGIVGFLKDARRANVMLSRARQLTLVVGNQPLWAKVESPMWAAFATSFPVCASLSDMQRRLSLRR